MSSSSPPEPAKPAPPVQPGFSLGGQSSSAPSYSPLLRDIEAGKVKSLELSPALRGVTATF
ncbi:hypothetical protein, partial [Cyanobium sp. N5-Cardenillas]|uniref:hypothetical protein n=1 Tax=Cyanobium sp. N5-Cardenillas TaxID=2823720 RepID=UPI0020CF7DA4